MPEQNERTCPNCRAPLQEGASFCPSCGAAVTAPAGAFAAAPPPPPGPPAPPQATAPGAGYAPPMPGAAQVGPGKKSKAPLIIGILGGLLLVGGIVVLILFLTVWKGGGKDAGTDSPTALAQKYMDSLEKGDIDAYMACFEEDFFTKALGENPLLEEMGMDEEDFKKYAEMAFEMMQVQFKGVKLKLESEEGNQALVVTTDGTASISALGYEEKLDLADDPLEFKMKKKGGRWYLTENPMEYTMSGGYDTQDFNLDNLDTDSLDLNDLQDMLPEDMNLEDMQDLSSEELNELMQQLEQMIDQEGSSQ